MWADGKGTVKGPEGSGRAPGNSAVVTGGSLRVEQGWEVGRPQILSV